MSKEPMDLNEVRAAIHWSAMSGGPSIRPDLVMRLAQELEETRAKHRQEWWRAEAAEAAVQRVRELAENAKASRYESTEFLHPLAILRALDGGDQE